MKNIKIDKMDMAWYIFFICSFLFPPIFGMSHYILTAFIFIITIARTRFRVKKEYSDCLLWFLFFVIYVSVSKIWARATIDNQKAIIITLIESVIVLYCILEYAKDERRIIRFAEIFANSMVVLAVAYYITSPSNTWGTEAMGTWLGIWRNAAGYYFGFASIILVFIYFNIKRNVRIVFEIIFLVGAAIGTGSRKIFLLGAVTVFMYVLLKKGIQKKIKYIVGAAILVIIALIVLFKIPVIKEMYGKRLLLLFKGINSSDASTVVRIMLIRQAIELFRISPIIGNGLEAFKIWMGGQTTFLNRWAMQATYSHCNYTELLANFGIIGFILYYFFIFMYLLKGMRYKNNLLVKLGIIIVVDCIMLDIGTVSYYFKYCLYILFVGVICIKKGIKLEKSIDA